MLALEGRDIRKTFPRERNHPVTALDGVSITAEHGQLTALVGPDGAGKTTLIRLITGLLSADSGQLKVLDLDVSRHADQVQSRVGYMPQKFGLYEDLTVQENLDLYAELHGITAAERSERYPRLMAMTGLGLFTKRLAGRLSGGMKQKLGLACTLVRSPELLILDEPTVGVDPLSRRELWEIIDELVKSQKLTVLLSTSYLDEAERCGHVIVLHEGKVLAQGSPEDVTVLAKGRVFLVQPQPNQRARDLQANLLDDENVVDAVPMGGQVRVVRTEGGGALPDLNAAPVAPRFEDGFMVLLRQMSQAHLHAQTRLPETPVPHGGDVVVEVRDLVRRFGTFTAVNHVSFQVKRGEIFGLLGPNGAGKTTTFRMLCGLLASSGGALRVAGVDVRHARASARQRLGYVAQKFALYGQLTVTENLDFFAGAYGLRGSLKHERIDWAMQEFELAPLASLPSGELAGGYKRRLAMAAALLHEPETLFLDEPTSGADPPARREFWRRITALSQQGVTIIVTTHFMEEAEYCDRVAIMDGGKVLAQGTPAEIRRRAETEAAKEPTMEDAFIAIVQEARNETPSPGTPGEGRGEGSVDSSVAQAKDPLPNPPPEYRRRGSEGWIPQLRRVRALVIKETRQVVRDPSSIAIGVVLPVILILLFGYGLSLDVKNVPVAVVMEDVSPSAADLAAGFRLSPYFNASFMTSMPQARDMLARQQVDGIVRIRPDFSRQMVLNEAPVQIIVDGLDANKARIIEAYAQARSLNGFARNAAQGQIVSAGQVEMVNRLWFNEADDSHYFLVPGLVVLVMTLIGALLTTMVMSREWERGTLEALFVTPVRTDEILLGKTVPYFVLGMVGLFLCLLSAKFLFHVPFRGSPWLLVGTSTLYLLVALGIGLLISSAVKSQFVASQMTLLVTFLPATMLSGFLFDLRSMPAVVRGISLALPARYYVSLLQTIFLAGNVWSIIIPNAAMLAGMACVLIVLTRRTMRKKLG